jgi:RHS repeat-associated protein
MTSMYSLILVLAIVLVSNYGIKILDMNRLANEAPDEPYSNVMLDTGEFVYNEVDLSIPGRGFDFVFARTYRSQSIYSGPLGWGWDHNYNKRLVELYSGDIIYYDGTGRRERFKVKDKPGTYLAPKGWFAELKRTEDGAFRLVYPEGIIEFFDSVGRLIKIQDRNNNKMEFYYNVSGQLSAVMDAMGRLIEFEYNNYSIEEIRASGEVKPDHGRLSRIIDYSGRVVEFTYNNVTGDLWKVEITSENDEDKADPKFHSRTVTYTYHPNPGGDISLSHNLFTVTDPKGQTALTVNYDSEGKDKVVSHVSGDSTVKYDLKPGNPTVFDGMNNEKRFTLNEEGHIQSITEVTEDGLNPTTGFEYVNGLLENVLYPRQNSVKYGYKDGLLSTITEKPAPGAVEDPEYPVETDRVTTFTYEEGKNNLQSIAYPGGLQQNYTYNKFGQVTSEYANMVLEGDTIPMGQTLFYNYHPEYNPGGDLPTPETPRLLDNSTGGYLKRSTSSFGEILNPNDWGYWENYTYNQRGNLSLLDSYNKITANYKTNIFNQVTSENITSPVIMESLSPMSYSGDYDYDKNGNLKTETTTSASLTRSATYDHDLRNNLKSVNDTIQGLTTYTYDKNDNVTSISGPGGAMDFTYNKRDLVHTVTIGDETYIFTYDVNGNMSTFTDPYGYTTTYGYDGYDRLSMVKDPLNNVTLIGRSQFGNLLSLKNLDSAQNLLFHSISIDDPLGQMTSYTVKMPDGEDIIYTITYEDEGRIIKIKDPQERETKVEKNKDGRVFRVTDAAGNMTEYFYEDGRGNATRVVETVKSADGEKTETYETKYEYNAHNKLEKIIDPQLFETEFYYDQMGNLKGSKDAEVNNITHEYDALGRRTKTTKYFKDGQKIETTFEYYPGNTYNPTDNTGAYSPSNRLKSITDDKGNKTTYEYDHQNRIKKIIYPDDSFIEYTYDKVEAGTNPAGDTVYYRLLIEKQRDDTIVKSYFDQLQRLMKREITPAEGAVGTTLETFQYDGLSRVYYAADNDTQLNFQYDRANRLDWEKRAGKLIDYSYDRLSNLRTIQYPNTRLFERNFDQLNRVNLIKENNITIADMMHIGRSYRLLRKQYGNGDLIQYLYDHGRRLEYKETRNKNSDLINHYRYVYNKVHMKTFEQRLHDSGKGNVMAYDDIYRLTNMKFNAPDPTIENPTTFEKEKAIKYDHLHNILNIVENFNGQTKTITTDIPGNSVYSKLNQYASFDQWGLGYEKKGNTTQRGTQQLAYDYRNQLVTANDAPSNTQVEMKYDVLGRRTQKSVSIGSQTKIENYYHSGHQVIEIRDENDQVLRQYIYGNGIDEIIRMDKYEGDTFTSYYYHTDANGSVTAITDANGQLVERVTYDIYGMPTFWDAAGNKISKSSIGNNILFHGREYDTELNLYYFRARYYDPIMGRFLQTDPTGYLDSMNLYQGFNMNPVNFMDPFGKNVYIEVTPSGSGTRDQLSLEEFWYALRQNYSCEDAIKIIKATEGYGDISDQQIMALEVGATTQPFEIYVGGAALMMFEFSPAGVFKDIVSLPFGKDLVSGEKLKWWQKALIATPFVIKAISKGSKLIKVLSEGIEEGSDIAKPWIKSIPDDELAEAVGAGLKNNPSGGTGPVNAGKIGEDLAGIGKNKPKIRIESLSNTAKYRIPDELLRDQKILREIKNVGKLSYTKQIRDFNAWAKKYGYKFILQVRLGAKISGTILEEIERGNIILKQI